jgi:NagD protein
MAKAYLIDMDGVLVRGQNMIPGADGFIRRLRDQDIPFRIFTNNSLYTPDDHQRHLQKAGIEVPEGRIFTSAMATASFLSNQRPKGSAFVIGEYGMYRELEQVGFEIREGEADYVVLAETTSYDFNRLSKAVRLIEAGARFVATNPDVSGPSTLGTVVACGAVAAMLTAATGVKAYFIGKPNPFMMRSALQSLGVHSSETTMVGDRMDTDIVAGTESGLRTVLVLTGVTKREDVSRYAYTPNHIVESVADLPLQDQAPAS